MFRKSYSAGVQGLKNTTHLAKPNYCYEPLTGYDYFNGDLVADVQEIFVENRRQMASHSLAHTNTGSCTSLYYFFTRT